MAERNDTGREGENEARRYLESCGYCVLHVNWRWHRYELDIVARQGGELVVVEVKTRSAGYLVDPGEAVDRPKIRRIVAAADAYVRRFHIEQPVRFDVMLLVKEKDTFRIDHLKDAFYAPVH